MSKSVEYLKPFSLELAPVADASPGSYVFEDDESVKFPVNMILITNTTGQILYVRLQPQGSPADIIVNGGFANGDNWEGDGTNEWSIGSGVAAHDVGFTVALRQVLAGMSGQTVTQISKARRMLTVFTVSSWIAGTIQIKWVGGSTPSSPKAADAEFMGTARGADGTFVESIRIPDVATSRFSRIEFVPTSAADLAIDDVKVYPDGAHASAGAHDLKIADGATQVIPPSWGIRTDRIGVWVPSGGTAANIGIWGMHVPANRV